MSVSICQCGAQASYPHTKTCPFPLFHDAPADVDRWTYEETCNRACQAGVEHGRAAASWYFDGNTTDETYAAVVRGIDDGDPEVLESLPSSPLSGEWADEPTPTSVLADLGVGEDDDAADDYLRAYEDGFSEASVC